MTGRERGPGLAIVVARARNGIIGRQGGLPWRMKSDMALFKSATLGKPVIMGRKTWDSLPRAPLPRRTNIVLSRDGSFDPLGAIVCTRFEEAVAIGREQAAEDEVDEVCVIGGAALFALAAPRARRLYLTEVEAEPAGDVTLPAFDEAAFHEVKRESFPRGDSDDYAFTYRVLERG